MKPQILRGLRFLFSSPCVASARVMGIKGYRTKRVGFVVTFRLVGAEKLVLKVVGGNLKDGHIVLLGW